MTTYRFTITYFPEQDEELHNVTKYMLIFKTNSDFKNLCDSLDALMEDENHYISYGFSRMKAGQSKSDFDKFYKDFAVNILKLPNINI